MSLPVVVGVDYYREGVKVVRVLAIRHKTGNGKTIVLKTVFSVLPEWPTGVIGAEE